MQNVSSETAVNTAVQPRIFPESEHPIREQMLDREALKVLYRLRDAGFKGYLVGGGVRDLFLGRKPKDFDISTDARPGQLRNLFKNSRTIGKRFRLVQAFFHGNKVVEISTLRSRCEYDENGEGALLAANNTFGTLEEDAFRRDLTINALFYEVENHTVIDYVGGVEDLNRGVIRMVGDPDLRFCHDPVRMLRVIRHAARTGFAVEKSTREAIERHPDKLMLCPPSRLRDEVLKDLHSGASRAWAELCMDTPLWWTLFPFYKEGGQETRSTLFRILTELDRIYQNSSEAQPVHIDDYFLFAALLLPWAVAHFGLFGEMQIRSPRFHELALSLRDNLDKHFGTRFNIKRLTKERISTLMIHLATLHHEQVGEKSPPKWLKHKSYYAECKRLYDLYQLGIGQSAAGIAVEDFIQREPEVSAVKPAGETVEENQAHAHPHGKGAGNPAFSSDKGGVFGLRKQR